MKIICSNQKIQGQDSSWEGDSRGVVFLSSELVTDLPHIKARRCDGSTLTYGCAATLLLMFIAHRIGNSFKRAAMQYTNTHMEDISLANGQTEKEDLLTKAQLDNDSLLKPSHDPIPAIYYE